MNAFDAAMFSLFRDPNMAADATYTPAATGVPFKLRAIRTAPDVTANFGAAQFSSASVLFDVHVEDLAQPVAGDRIEFDGEARIVQGTPERDDHRLIWTLDTRPA